MRKASTVLLEQGTQTPSPAPDLIPAENERQSLTGNSHSDWYSERGHFTRSLMGISSSKKTGGRTTFVHLIRTSSVRCMRRTYRVG